MIEERLRTALAGLADELPPSGNPLAEHHRRLAVATRARRRRPMLAATAAAVVFACGVTPFVLTRGDGAPVATPPTSTPAPPPMGFEPGMDDPYRSAVGDPVRLAEFTDGGQAWTAWVLIDRTLAAGGWEHRVCVMATPTGQPETGPVRHPNSAGCSLAFQRPADQPQSKVETRSMLGGPEKPASGPLPGLLLFITVPEVSRLEVRAAYGEPVPVKQLVRIPELALFLADFGTSYEGFGYTARDSAGNVIESGIT
jgi:hypothetical protein